MMGNGHAAKVLFVVLMTGLVYTTEGQEVSVKSGFFMDSLRVGDETGYYLSASYPSDRNILFPDSTFSFAPFEYDRRKYFPTRTVAGTSYDSVIYYLSTFEIDRVQSLQLPVFQLNPMDCTVYLSPRDTILLTSLVPDLPDSLTAQNIPLKTNTAYQRVLFLFNSPLLVIVVTALVVTTIVVWLAFGKRIRRRFRIRRMERAHSKFLESYGQHVDIIKQAFSSVSTENALALWKKYMEQLEARPYTKLTTRETLKLEKNDALGKNLHAVDRAIYGHNTSVMQPLENLRSFADERFMKKLEEIKNG
jgi:hypothetical protein